MRRAAVFVAMGLTFGCLAEPPRGESQGAPLTEAEEAFDDSLGSSSPAAAPQRKRASRGGAVGRLSAKPKASLQASLDEAPADAEKGAEAPQAPTRSWFPETFLFAPSVPTDDRGEAQLAITVPDRLTTWRILALGHDRQGGRGGTVTTFDSTLPTYIDPVLPDMLIAGDRVELPVLVVNTTDQRVETTLTVEAHGAALSKWSGSVSLGPQQNAVRYVPIAVKQSGQLTMTYSLGESDRIERRVPVRAPGRPVVVRRRGALADQVDLQLPTPKDVRPDSIQVGLTVYPGALALLGSELTASADRMGLAESAYALRVAGIAQPLIERLGGRVDPERLRRLRLKVAQRLLRGARRPSVVDAMVIAQGAGPFSDDPLLGRLSDRMARTLAAEQRPDGTFTGGDGWSLQRVVVATAAGIAALKAVADDEATKRLLRGARIRAEGAFERYVDAVKDPYTAAAVLAVDGARGTLKEKLRERVRTALSGTEAVRLKPGGVVRADGRPPTVADATALAVLGLRDDPEARPAASSPRHDAARGLLGDGGLGRRAH